jgi:hypothetical protein
MSEALLGKIDDMLVSCRASAFGLLSIARGRDRQRGAKAARDLHGFHPYGAANGGSQPGLPRPELRELRQRQIACQISCAREVGRGLIVIDGVRDV